MKGCVFCKIVAGTHPRQHVWEDERYLAFMANRTLRRGHLLIIPKQHIDYFFDMDSELYLGIFSVAAKLEPAVKKVTNAVRVGLAVEGFGVAHAHLHVIPMFGQTVFDSKLARDESEKDLNVMAQKIRSEVEGSVN